MKCVLSMHCDFDDMYSETECVRRFYILFIDELVYTFPFSCTLVSFIGYVSAKRACNREGEREKERGEKPQQADIYRQKNTL